ncbi:hypothetical protein [Rubrolithibacter danxiaensis]|uniref:hypothetical protein n=1 Tax=Rubrolithibacter danxiaensis TaxID=3390805 RepID=UPI003BF7EF25
MSLFRSYSSIAEVSGRILKPVAEGMPNYSEVVKKLLGEHGISDIRTQDWYLLQKFLDTLQEVLKKYGPFTLFTLGKLVTESFPYQFDNLQTALMAVNQIYQANHRNGDAGYCEVLFYDDKKKRAQMKCKMPYPAEFQRGVLISLLRKYKEAPGFPMAVTIEPNEKGIREEDDHLFEVSW